VFSSNISLTEVSSHFNTIEAAYHDNDESMSMDPFFIFLFFMYCWIDSWLLFKSQNSASLMVKIGELDIMMVTDWMDHIL